MYNNFKSFTWLEVRQRVNTRPGLLRWGTKDLKTREEETFINKKLNCHGHGYHEKLKYQTIVITGEGVININVKHYYTYMTNLNLTQIP